MSFSRIKYDECQYSQQIKRSTDVGEYRLFAPAYESCEQCYSNTGPIGAKSDVSVPRDGLNLDFGVKADAESHLTNRVLPHGECNDIGKNNEYNCLTKSLVHAKDCQKKLNSVDTRFTHPLDAFRGMNTTEYHFNPYLHVNPQCEYQTWREGTNSRLIAKDTYQIPKTKILDKGAVLPKPKPLKLDTPQCGVCGSK